MGREIVLAFCSRGKKRRGLRRRPAEKIKGGGGYRGGEMGKGRSKEIVKSAALEKIRCARQPQGKRGVVGKRGKNR